MGDGKIGNFTCQPHIGRLPTFRSQSLIVLLSSCPAIVHDYSRLIIMHDYQSSWSSEIEMTKSRPIQRLRTHDNNDYIDSHDYGDSLRIKCLWSCPRNIRLTRGERNEKSCMALRLNLGLVESNVKLTYERRKELMSHLTQGFTYGITAKKQFTTFFLSHICIPSSFLIFSLSLLLSFNTPHILTHHHYRHHHYHHNGRQEQLHMCRLRVRNAQGEGFLWLCPKCAVGHHDFIHTCAEHTSIIINLVGVEITRAKTSCRLFGFWLAF